MRDRGLRVPESISVAAFGDAEENDDPQYNWLTSYSQPTYNIGRQAARLLINRIQDSEPRSVRILLQGQFNVRSSTAPPPEA